jgi:hypothetical protein
VSLRLSDGARGSTATVPKRAAVAQL